MFCIFCKDIPAISKFRKQKFWGKCLISKYYNIFSRVLSKMSCRKRRKGKGGNKQGIILQFPQIHNMKKPNIKNKEVINR